MNTFTPVILEDDLMADVVEEVDFLCEESAATLVLLGHDPNDRQLVDKLFRSVHTIKGDIGIAQMTPMLPLLRAIEDILAMMREGFILHDSLLSDLLLTILEHVKSFVDDCANLGNAEYDANMYERATLSIDKVKPDNIEEHAKLLSNALIILEPALAPESDSSLFTQELDDLRINWADEVEPDLVFFHSIMKPVEERLDNWQGRSSRQLKLALLLNQFAGKLVDEQQLRAAVYLHDIGMSLLPLALLRQKTSLLEPEIARLRGHVQRSVNFLSEMPHWSDAKRYIHEHHERVDGQGYPSGLTGDQISHGAKILALVDAIEAMTHERAQQVHRKRPIQHALHEINHASGSQFCPYWVNILNKVMAPILNR